MLLDSLSFIDHYAKNGQVLLLMEEILHQLRLVVYPIIYIYCTEFFFYIPGGDRRVSEPSTVSVLFHQRFEPRMIQRCLPFTTFLAGASRPTMSFEAENSTEIGQMIWRVGRNSISHSIHGTGIFTYMNG